MSDTYLVKASVLHVTHTEGRIICHIARWIYGDSFVFVARTEGLRSSEIGNPDQIGQVFAINQARDWLVEAIKTFSPTPIGAPLFVFYEDENDGFISDWLKLNLERPKP